MNTVFRYLLAALMVLSVCVLSLCGCQQKEPAPVEGKSESQMDAEYRSLLAEVGLNSDGAAIPPAQIDAPRYGQLLLATAGHGSPEMLARLLSARSEINLNERYDGRTLLHAAAASLNTANSDLLLERGVDPDSRDTLGRTALHLVVAQSSGFDLARLLLSRGAAVDIRDEQGMTPLLSAIPACVRLLADKGADLSVRDNQGNSALHWAVYRKSPELAELLTALGAPLDLQNNAGRTPLHLAVAAADQKMAQLLLKAGAKSDIADTGGITPQKLAEKSGNLKVRQVFGLSQ